MRRHACKQVRSISSSTAFTWKPAPSQPVSLRPHPQRQGPGAAPTFNSEPRSKAGGVARKTGSRRCGPASDQGEGNLGHPALVFWLRCHGRMALATGALGCPSLVPSDIPGCTASLPHQITLSSVWAVCRDCAGHTLSRGGPHGGHEHHGHQSIY